MKQKPRRPMRRLLQVLERGSRMEVTRSVLVLAVVSLFILEARAKLKGDDCEVCVSFLHKFVKRMDDRGVQMTDPDRIEVELMKACADSQGKDHRFCYYIGASEISATKLVREVTKPLSFGKPVEKICEQLKKKDEQICELKYEKQIDLNNVDLKKLKVKELKKILSQWGEECRGCAEKSDYISKINDLKPLHTEL